jgi:UDP-N-acetyl-D-mannosaminuronate dehydrogenase
MEGQALTAQILHETDLTVITTDHSDIDYDWVVQNSKAVLDTRNATRNVTAQREKITLL